MAVFIATLNNNASATALKARLPMTINIKELNGKEKFYDFTNTLPANSSNPGAIGNVDMMLCLSAKLVQFNKSFSAAYRYTQIGRIDNSSDLEAALG